MNFSIRRARDIDADSLEWRMSRTTEIPGTGWSPAREQDSATMSERERTERVNHLWRESS